MSDRFVVSGSRWFVQEDKPSLADIDEALDHALKTRKVTSDTFHREIVDYFINELLDERSALLKR